LISDIEYYGKKSEAWKDFAINNFNPTALYHHYKSMCRQNYLKYLKSGSEVTYKKYLYAMRGLLNAKWVVSHKSVPKIDLTETINLIDPIIKKADFPNLPKVREVIPV
ncbi:MAG: nucleotidyltransferase domain-containing protein, partial [Nanoarchaeota archaeon]